MKKINGLFYKINIEERQLVHPGWVAEIEQIVDNFARAVYLDGNDSTSREPQATKGMTYSVVTGDVIKNKLPWLYDLYQKQFLDFVNEMQGEQYVIDDNLSFSININVLSHKGDRYEKHVDTEHISGVLFVTTHSEADGGALVFAYKDKLVKVHPTTGDFIIFDARNIEHEVTALISDKRRISIPMGFFIANQDKGTPDDLTDYLYNSANK